MKIRLATFAMPSSHNRPDIPATLDEVQTGYRLPWIELNGHKFEDFSGGQVAVKVGYNEAMLTSFTVDLIGPVELVYLRRDGTEIGAVEVDASLLPAKMDCETVMPSPAELGAVPAEELARLRAIEAQAGVLVATVLSDEGTEDLSVDGGIAGLVAALGRG